MKPKSCSKAVLSCLLVVLDRNVPRLRRADDWLQLSLESSDCLVISPHLQVKTCNTVILQSSSGRTRICICIWLVNLCFKCRLWHITHVYTRISVIAFADFGVLLFEILHLLNIFVLHVIFQHIQQYYCLVHGETPLCIVIHLKKCLRTLEDVNPNYMSSQFPLSLAISLCLLYLMYKYCQLAFWNAKQFAILSFSRFISMS